MRLFIDLLIFLSCAVEGLALYMQFMQRARSRVVSSCSVQSVCAKRRAKGKASTRQETWASLVRSGVSPREFNGLGPPDGRTSGRHTCPCASPCPTSLVPPFEQPDMVAPWQKRAVPRWVCVLASSGHVISPLDEFLAHKHRPGSVFSASPRTVGVASSTERLCALAVSGGHLQRRRVDPPLQSVNSGATLHRRSH